MSEIAFHHVSKVYRDSRGNINEVFRDINVVFTSGEFTCILGASGCGKSTILNMVAGLESPTSGSITVDSLPISGPSPERGMVFQQFALFPWLSVLQNVEFGLRLQGLSAAERRERAHHYLSLVGLSKAINAMPKELSGGMKQRCALARAYAVRPRILLMDEPFGSLDALTRSQLQDDLLEMRKEESQTVLFVTHDVDEAAYLGDRSIVLDYTGPQCDLRRTFERKDSRGTRFSNEYQALRRELWETLHGLEHPSSTRPIVNDPAEPHLIVQE